MTDRLLLRPLSADDLGAVHALHTDDAVMRYLSRDRPTRAQVRDELLPLMLAWRERDPAWGYTVAEDRATGAFLGWLLWRPALDRPAPDEREIGWRFARAAWGRGYATEGARAVLDRGLADDPAVRSVFARTMAVNTPSRRVMERLGMRHVRTFHEHHDDPLPGTEHGEVEYRLDR